MYDDEDIEIIKHAFVACEEMKENIIKKLFVRIDQLNQIKDLIIDGEGDSDGNNQIAYTHLLLKHIMEFEGYRYIDILERKETQVFQARKGLMCYVTIDPLKKMFKECVIVSQELKRTTEEIRHVLSKTEILGNEVILHEEIEEYCNYLINISCSVEELVTKYKIMAQNIEECDQLLIREFDDSHIKNKKVEINKVQFSAIAPKIFIKGEYTVIDIIMYEEAYKYVVDELCKEAEMPVKETKSGIHKVKECSQIRVCLASPDIEIEDNEEVQEWQGEYLRFSFAVLLPEQYQKQQILFNASIFVNDVIATKLKFVVKCSSFCEQKITISRNDIVSAFFSYASQDRKRVATIIQGMKKARPDMDIFFDVDSLRSGENWEKTLWYEIEKRDILFLCWSHFASQSKWVDAEWRYALEHKGIECIEPIPMIPPDLCPPPEELRQKHFNDKLLYIINADSEPK